MLSKGGLLLFYWCCLKTPAGAEFSSRNDRAGCFGGFKKSPVEISLSWPVSFHFQSVFIIYSFMILY